MFRQINGGSTGVLATDTEEGMNRKVAKLVTKEKKHGDGRFRRFTWWYPSRPDAVLIQVCL